MTSLAKHPAPHTARTRPKHPRPPRSGGPMPAGNLPNLASRRGKLRPGYDHGTRAPQQPQSGPQSRLRDRDVSTLGWRRRILSRTNLCEEFPYWRRGARRAQGSYPVLVGLDLCRLANRPPGRREACRSRHRRDAAQVHDLTQPLQRLNCQGRGCARQLP